jgi:two-component system sensor histidine kinase YesM
MQMHIKQLFSYKNWSFKKKLLVIISALIIVLVILITFSSYILYSRNFTKQTSSQTQQIIEQVAINVDTYMDELFRLNLSPYYNDDIMQELEDEYTTKLSSLSKKRKIENFLASVMTLPRSEILRVYILTDSNLYSYTRTPYDMEDYDDYRNTDWYQEATLSSTPVFVPIHFEKVFGEKTTQIFSIVQRIRSKEDNSKVLAVIKVDADYSGIKSICDKVQLKEKGSLFILDENKSLVYQNNQLDKDDILQNIGIEKYKRDGNYTETINSEKYIINISSLENTVWKVIAVNSDRELNKDAKTIRNLTILLSFLCMLLSVSLLFVLIQNFLKPLFNIVSLMKQVQDGDLSVHVEVKNNDELGYLARSFNIMILRITEILDKNTQLVKEVYESRYLQKEAQYNILCSQIKPHFLYNTLNTISLLIKCKDSKGAIQSIEKLSYFLRGIMNADKNISLSTELEIVPTSAFKKPDTERIYPMTLRYLLIIRNISYQL